MNSTPKQTHDASAQVRKNRDRLIQILCDKEQCVFDSESELFDQSLLLMAWAVGEVKKGGAIASVFGAQNIYLELRMPFIERLEALKAASNKGG